MKKGNDVRIVVFMHWQLIYNQVSNQCYKSSILCNFEHETTDYCLKLKLSKSHNRPSHGNNRKHKMLLVSLRLINVYLLRV